MSTFTLEYVRCGKGCRGCPHGPYWYETWKEKISKGRFKTRRRYVGKQDPRTSKDANDPWEKIFGRTYGYELEWEIMGCQPTTSFYAARSQYRKQSMIYHPDRGGSENRMAQLNEAWAHLRRGWRWTDEKNKT